MTLAVLAPSRPASDSPGVSGQTSTAARAPAAARLVHSFAGVGQPLAEIETRRVALGVSLTALCRDAGVVARSYRRWRQGRAAPPRAALQRLGSALDRAGRPDAAGEAAGRAIDATIAGCAALAAALLPATLAGRPVADRAALARHVGWWACHLFVGAPQARLAARLGLTRAALCKAVARIEAGREADPAFAAALDALTRAVFDDAA